jgi:hypothetical protein
MLRLLEALFVMVSALSAAVAVRDARGARDEERRDRWRRESERHLDALADAVVGVGEAAAKWRESPEQGAELEVARLRLARARLDALNPWIDLGAISDVSELSPAEIDRDLLDRALDDIANNVERVRDEARKTWRERKRELRRL